MGVLFVLRDPRLALLALRSRTFRPATALATPGGVGRSLRVLGWLRQRRMLLVFRTLRRALVHRLGGVGTYAVLFYGLLGTGPPWRLPRRVLGLVGSGGLPAGRFLRLSLTMRGLAWRSALPRGLLVLRP
jgi:hypothetical protein